jgi:hypothetical protein
MQHSAPNAAKFTSEMSVIVPMYHAARRCRCPVTRRRAVALLERGLPREGLFDTEQHVLVLKRIVEFEERELDPRTGWPVEETRLWGCVIDANMGQNGGSGFICCLWFGLGNLGRMGNRDCFKSGMC